MNKKLVLLYLFCLVLGSGVSVAQVTQDAATSENRVATTGLWKNWFLQAGLDMSLQNPYGYNFSNVFPNGKTFGVDVAVGKWFTPVLGLRAKVNWENGIGLFRNNHANWLAPFDEPGVNMDKGGYIGVLGDVLFNVHNLFWGYDSQRRWNLSVFPRAGIDYNFGVAKGSPLLGVGITNTYRLNDRLGIYMDLAYNMVSSGHVGVVESTGLNSSSNGYFTIDAGVQVDLGADRTIRQADTPLWTGWFLQAGLDMHLQNPYGCNFFSGVFPNGKTFGLEAAVGRQFTPQVALRGKLDWENGLFANNHLKWVAPADAPERNHDEGGYLLMTLDAMFNVQNFFGAADTERKWNTMVYPRMGLIHVFAIDSSSPLLGAGIENTYRLNDRLSLYLDVDYRVTTSDSSYGTTGMEVSNGTNGFFGIHAGVQIDLGGK